MRFTRRIHNAIDVAARAHEGQFRKDHDFHLPYAAHVFGVAFLLAEFDFDEDVIVAGLLHDVLEDRPSFRPEVEQFGPGVLALVEAVSETKLDAAGNERAWPVRKNEYIEHIRTAPPGAKAISCADKIHNMQSILLAIDRGGEAIWNSLKATPEAQLDRLRRLREALAEGWSHPILERFDSVFAELVRRAGEAAAGR